MLDRLRTPLFFVALALIFLAVVLEMGTTSKLQQLAPAAVGIGISPSGKGILSLAFLDGLLLYTSILMGLSLIVPERIQGRWQGIVSLIFSILLLIGGVVSLFAVFQLLILMVTLLMAPIFGTMAYFLAFASFNASAARVTLGMAMTLKLLFTGCLILAHQRFLQNKGLMLLIASSLLATFVLELLHAIVPGFLVSITDALGAIFALILAIVWGILLLVSSLFAIVKAIT